MIFVTEYSRSSDAKPDLPQNGRIKGLILRIYFLNHSCQMPLLSYRGLLNILPPSAERLPLAEPAATRSDISLLPIQSLLSPLSPSPLPYTSLPEAPCTPKREKAVETTRSNRIRIKTALLFNYTPEEIRDKLSFTLCQIQ
jgi:hypothetical protein